MTPGPRRAPVSTTLAAVLLLAAVAVTSPTRADEPRGFLETVHKHSP